MTGFLTLATVDGRRVDLGSEGPPGPPVPAQTMRFLCEMRRLHDQLAAATKAAATLDAYRPGGSAVTEGLVLEILRDVREAQAANLEAQRLVPHLIGLVIVEAGEA